jgi:hypothetical protein
VNAPSFYSDTPMMASSCVAPRCAPVRMRSVTRASCVVTRRTPIASLASGTHLATSPSLPGSLTLSSADHTHCRGSSVTRSAWLGWAGAYVVARGIAGHDTSSQGSAACGHGRAQGSARRELVRYVPTASPINRPGWREAILHRHPEHVEGVGVAAAPEIDPNKQRTDGKPCVPFPAPHDAIDLG